MSYKKISQIFVAFLAMLVVSPSISMAVGNGEMQGQRAANKADIQAQRAADKEEKQAERVEKTCAMISTQGEQIQARLTERISQLTQKRSSVEARIKQQTQQRTAALTQKRTTWSGTRSANWEKLRSKAQTEEQKAAVEKFILAVQNAVKAKNEAVDKIISSFRTELQSKNSQRKSEIDSEITGYRNAVASVVAQMKSDCASGKSAQEVRSSFKANLQKARNEFRNEIKTRTRFGEEVVSLKNAKKIEMQAVLEAFKNSVEQAKTELRTAFPPASE